MTHRPDSLALSLRIEPPVSTALVQLAAAEGVEPAALVQRIVKLHVANSGRLPESECDRILLTEDLVTRAIGRARDLDRDGRFDAHFTLTVLDDLFADPAFAADYERAVGGDAMARGTPAKASLNMNLGWQIKSAARARPVLDANGKPRRVKVRGRPIQSYTLLTRDDPRGLPSPTEDRT